MISKSTVLPETIIKTIIKGYVFTLVDTTTKMHVTYKTVFDKTMDHCTISAKTTGNKYIDIGSFYYSIAFFGALGIAHKKEFYNDPMFTLLRKFYIGLTNNQPQSNIEIWHPFPCLRCKRLLTDPTSIDRGTGPGCAKKQQFNKKEVQHV